MQNRTTPTEAIVAEMVRNLDTDKQEEFEERAAIFEYEGHLSRNLAECLALLNVLHRSPSALTGITVLQVELGNATEWLLTTDLAFTRQHLAYIGAKEIGSISLTGVIERQYGGIATLATLR